MTGQLWPTTNYTTSTSCSVYCNTLLGPWLAAVCTLHCVLDSTHSVFSTTPPSTTLKHLVHGVGLDIETSSKCSTLLTCMGFLTEFGDEIQLLLARRLRFKHGWHTTSLYKQQNAVNPNTTVKRLKARLPHGCSRKLLEVYSLVKGVPRVKADLTSAFLIAETWTAGHDETASGMVGRLRGMVWASERRGATGTGRSSKVSNNLAS